MSAAVVTGASRGIGQHLARPGECESGLVLVARDTALRFVWRRHTYVPCHDDIEPLEIPTDTTAASEPAQ